MIFTVKVASGKEDSVLEELEGKSRTDEKECLYSAMVLPGIKGYIFIEASKEEDLRDLLKDIRYLRGGIVQGIVGVEELKEFIEDAPIVELFQPGKEIEVMRGPFRGSKGRIIKLLEKKEQIVVELFDSLVKIPISMNVSYVRLKEDR